MPTNRPEIIADGPALAHRRACRLVLALALSIGILAAWHYSAAGLTLSHYDARAHMVVSRRILDSLTPGWRQIGAVWLPLPHVLNAIPIQWDFAYRTGLVAVAFSVLAMALGLAALADVITRRTGSIAAALASALLIQLNPNVLYLQSTPMTEPLLFGLAFLALAAVDRWIDDPSPRVTRRAGVALVLLMLTRYEGWFIAAGLVGVAAIAARRRGWRGALALVPWAAGAVLAFLVLSKATVGAWFVSGGFFIADNPARHQVGLVLDQIRETTGDLGGRALLWSGAAGAVASIVALRRGWAHALPLCLALSGALPFIAFYEGHPLRVRYMVPLVAAAGALSGLAVSIVPSRARGLAAALLVGVVVWQRPPTLPDAPMLLEAQWETPYRLARAPVTAYLDASWDGTPILASMGSLAHYMQQTSAIGLDIGDFLHEGNADLWTAAVLAPRRHVHWILIEERAEGGDELAARAENTATFLAGFARVAEGGGVALYRRVE